jgi:hypothetical protein
LQDATVQAIEAAEDMQRALCAAAKLLKDCTCQTQRAAESLRACAMANSAISRWQGAVKVIENIARHKRQTERAQ